VDDITSIQRIEMLSFVQVPESGSSVLTTRSAQRSIRRYSDSVNVSSVANQVGSQLAVGKVPNFDEFVPSSRYNDGVGSVGGKSHARYPLSVSILVDGILALTQSVPQLDGLVSSSRDNLSVISGESNAQNILGVSNESSGGDSSVEIPQSEGSIPRSSQSKLAIRGNNHVLDKVRVSSEGFFWLTVVLIRLSGNGPDDEVLISGSRNKKIWVLRRSGEASNPAIVALKNSFQVECFCHFDMSSN